METKVTNIKKVEFKYNEIECSIEIDIKTKGLICAYVGEKIFYGENGLKEMETVYEALTIFKNNI